MKPGAQDYSPQDLNGKRNVWHLPATCATRWMSPMVRDTMERVAVFLPLDYLQIYDTTVSVKVSIEEVDSPCRGTGAGGVAVLSSQNWRAIAASRAGDSGFADRTFAGIKFIISINLLDPVTRFGVGHRHRGG
jgi:hypothetical protein